MVESNLVVTLNKGLWPSIHLMSRGPPCNQNVHVYDWSSSTVRVLCVHVYVCVFECMHGCVWTSMCGLSLYACKYACICVHVYVCSCACSCVCACVCACICVHVCCVCTCVCMRVFMCVYMCVYVLCVHVYVCVCSCVFMCVCAKVCRTHVDVNAIGTDSSSSSGTTSRQAKVPWNQVNSHGKGLGPHNHTVE